MSNLEADVLLVQAYGRGLVVELAADILELV